MGMRAVRNNFDDENLNPCFDEGKLTKKCMNENSYDSIKCSPYFENYKNCLKFWWTIKQIRNFKGIKPALPDKEEREKILKEKEKGNKVFVMR